jgi:hypothetical protein
MNRETFWATEFSKTASEFVAWERDSDEEGWDDSAGLADDAAKWADLALAEYDKRFGIASQTPQNPANQGKWYVYK